MKIQNISISKIKPYENNPRNNTEAVQYVANSIKEFGFKQPIVIDKNFEIVAGHTRYFACKKLGIKEVSCVMADDLTDEQVKAYRIADNSTGEAATWDFDLLNVEIDGLDFDFKDFGLDLEFEELEQQKIEEQELKPFAKVHYLITADINENQRILNIIEQLKQIEGVEIESTLN